MAVRKGSNSMRLFVSNLRWSNSSECLKAYFSKFGKVGFVNVVFDRETGWSKRYGFVGMESIESSQKILNHNTHMLTDDHQIRVDRYTQIDGPNTGIIKTRINKAD